MILGDYDDLKPPNVVSKGWDYICITDQDISSNFWRIIRVEPDLDNKWYTRYIWTHFYDFFDCDYVLKHDAGMRINDDLNILLNYNKNNDITLSFHDRRNCIYDEAIAVNERFPEYSFLVERQMKRYKALGFPSKYGLHFNGVRLMKNNEKVRTFNKLWWIEIKSGSWRDQLSFDYIRWKLRESNYNMKINEIDFNLLCQKLFIFHEHKSN